MTKVTYMLGAGASVQVLPTVKKIVGPYGIVVSEGLGNFFARKAVELKEEFKNQEIPPFFQNIAKTLASLETLSDQFGSVDVYAKYLFLKGQSDLLRQVKQAIVYAFASEQSVIGKEDNRALSFLTTVMQSAHRFPENIKIITWNFDFQLEFAASYFRQEEMTESEGVTVNKPPLFRYYPPLGKSYFLEPKEYSLVHMNGIAGMYKKDENSNCKSLFPPGRGMFSERMLSDFEEKEENSHSLLTFAWEKGSAQHDLLNDRLEIAKQMVEGTDILVVVGYSFPFFNREFDQEIFNSLRGSLRKIYFQDPYRSGEFLLSQFSLHAPNHDPHLKIENVIKTDSYFVPMEL
jgi:hypothetical protein